MLERLLRVRVLERQERPRAQLPDEDGEPETTHSDRRQQVQPMQAEVLGIKGWLDEPEEVNEAQQYDQSRDQDEHPPVIFDFTEQQQEEGQEEMKDDEHHCHPTPTTDGAP